eukprot:scaffold69790_cov58-Phaeocystis_antarctica.AAC.1
MDAAGDAQVEGLAEELGEGKHDGALDQDHPEEEGGGGAPTDCQERLRPPARVVCDVVDAVGEKGHLPRLRLPVPVLLRLQKARLLQPLELSQVFTLHHAFAVHIRDQALPELALQANHGRQIHVESRRRRPIRRVGLLHTP